MKRSIIYLIFLSLGNCLLGDKTVVISPPASPRINSQADYTKKETAPNEVPVINIAQPNNAGVSHNCYEKFNVHREGLILNNSAVAAQSQLGGMLMGNANLAQSGSASLIVNEVVGPTQSQINGFIEVHGKAADLVVANPNGISVNGGGFINAPKVTLTTGIPEFDADGALQSLLVQQGKVTIGDQGMYVQDCNYCDILANAVAINGAIQGQKSEYDGTDMRIVSGYYRFDYPNRTATAEGGGAPIIGVDSSALGGMYAGKIYFVTKGRDVGVKLPPNMVMNAGDLVVEADGSIHIAGYVNSTGYASIQSSGEIFSENVTLSAHDKIDISANSVNMQHTNVFTPKILSINAADGITSFDSHFKSEKSLQFSGESINSIGDQFTSSDSIMLESTGRDLGLKKARFNSLGEISLQSAANLSIKGKVRADQRIALESDGDLHYEGVLESLGGEIHAKSSGNSLIKGKWVSRNGIGITGDQGVAIENHSSLMSEGPISVNAAHEASLVGAIRTKNNAIFRGDSGVIRGNVSSKNVEIITDGSLQMTGEVRTNQSLRIKSGEIQSKGAKLLSNQGVTIESTIGDLALANAKIQSPSDIALTAARDISFDGSLKTNEEIHSIGQQDVRMKGTIQGRTAQLQAQRNLFVEPMSDVRVNEGLTLAARNDAALQGQSQSGTLVILGDNIHVAGQHVSKGRVDIVAQNEGKFQGTLASVAHGIDLKANSLLETDGIINAKNDVTLVAQNLTQKGGIFSREGSVHIQTKQSKLSGDLWGTTGLELQSEDAINLEDTIQMASKGPIRIASNDVHLAGKLGTEGPIDIKANALKLKPQTELSGETLLLQQTGDQAIQWDEVTLQGQQQVFINSPGDVKISGSVLSSGDVMIESDRNMDLKSTDSQIGGKTTLKARNILSLSGLLLGLSSMLFWAEDVNIQSRSQIEGAADVVMDAQKTLAVLPNSAVASQDLSVKVPTITNEGVLQGSNSIDLNASQNLSNDGQILSNGQLAIATPTLQNNGLLQSTSADFKVANLSNAGGMWIAGPWSLLGDKASNIGWARIDGPWTGKFNTFENQAGWVKGTTVAFPDPMRWLNKARMTFSGDVLLPQSTFENISADFYSGGDVVLDTLRNRIEREPKVGPFRKVPELCRWELVEACGYSPAVKLSGDRIRITKSDCFRGDTVYLIEDFKSYEESGWPRGRAEKSWKEIVQENAIEVDCNNAPATFQASKNFNTNTLENSFSNLYVGGNLGIHELINRGAKAIRKKEHWKEKITITHQGSGNFFNGSDPVRRHDFVNEPGHYTVTQEIIKQFPSTIQVGGTIQGTVKSFMNGEAVAKDDNIKQGVALPAYTETAWDKEKAALKVLREGHTEPVKALRFSAPAVNAQPATDPMGTAIIGAVPAAEMVPAKEDEHTQLWRLQVQNFLDEARAEPLVFSSKHDAPYVVETNPMFINPGLFYGSQYFLDRVDLTSGGKPSVETRLGDAFFENQLIRQQIQAATNRFILSHQYADEIEQQMALYGNALAEARRLGLKAGERLTPDQVKKLTHDIVWLEVEEVDGKKVLVPRVYLCEHTKKHLSTSGTQLLAKAVDIQVEGDVSNQGLIEAEQDLLLHSSGTIANVAGKIATDKGDLSLQAGGNVLNISGEIASGKDLSISGKTIASATTKERMEGYKSHADVLGATAKVSAKNTLLLAADEHLSAVGSFFKGADVMLTSGGDMALDVAEKTYHYKDGGHNWSINEHGAHALQTTIKADKDVHLLSQDDLKTRAVKVNAGGDFTVKSAQGTVTSDAFKDYDYAYFYSHSSGGFLGGSSTTERTSYRAQDLGSDIVAQESGTLSAEKDIHLKAGKLAAKDLTIASKTGKVKLEAGEDKDFYHYYHKSSGLITTSVDDEGHDRTTQKPVEIAAQTVTVPSPAEIDYKSGVGKEFREALAGRTDINWNAVRDNYREWSEHTTTLNGPARLLVACVLTVLTQGMGSEWLAGQGIAEGAAMQKALGAGIDAVVASAGTALAGNLGDIGKAFDELTSAASLKSLAATMVTAGTSLSLSNALNLPQSPETFTETLKSNTVAGLVRTGVDSAIVGGNVGQNLAKNMTSSAVDSTSAQLAHGIGSAHAEGKLDTLSHKLAHAGLGAASAALTGGDATAGAIGATVGEMAAETLHKEGKNPQTTAAQARIIGDTVAFLAGKDVASADKAGGNAVENNFIDHLTEIDGQRALAKAVLSEEEAAPLLEILDADEQRTLEAAKDPIVNTITVTSAGMGIPVVAKTAAVVGTAMTAHHYGSIAVDSGAKGLVQEAKDHPILTTIAVVPFMPGPRGMGISKDATKALAKTEQATQQEFGFVQQFTPSAKICGTVVQSKRLTATPKSVSKQIELDLGKEKGVIEKVTKPRGRKTYEDLTPEQRFRAQELEGQVMEYGEAKKLTRGYGGYLEANEMPAGSYMVKQGVSRDKNIARVTYRTDHLQTRTFGGRAKKISAEANPRDELAKDLWDMRRILQKRDVDTTIIDRSLKEALDKCLEAHPQLFEKGVKKK